MRVRLTLFLLFLCPALAHASEVRGKIVNVVGGEPLARVQVTILETRAEAVTEKDGTFVIQAVVPGTYTLRLNAVGFRLSTVPFVLSKDELKEFDLALVPDNFRRTEQVEVKGDTFQGPDSLAVVESNLTSSEMRDASTVLADDTFRAVQALPGVSASGNNDFFAQFSVMGTPYDDVSTYIDGILIGQPFHGVVDVPQGATLSALTSETVEDVRLLPVAYPEKYGDAVGAALDIQTRDGSRTPPMFRFSAGLADSEILGEGQVGHARKGSWLASARKSYLGYLLRHRLDETFTNISFWDADLKLTYDLSPAQNVTFYGLGGHTSANLINPPSPLQAGEFQRGTNDVILDRLGWRWTLNPHLLAEARAAYLSTPLKEWDGNNNVLDNYRDREWVEGGRVVWAWNAGQVLDGGWTSRHVNSGYLSTLDGISFLTIRSGWRNDGYVQQTSSFFGNRLHLVGSVRFDTASNFDIHPLSPQLSAALQVARSTTVQFAVGRYNQFEFPAVQDVLPGPKPCVTDVESLQTANHFSAGVEHRFWESTRIRATFFDRQNQSQNAYGGGCPGFPSGFQGFGANYSRGVQFVVQSRTANRLSGWIGYTYTHARQNNFFSYEAQPGGPVTTLLSPDYPTLEDQLHSLNVFASYRLSPTVRLSGKFAYGSGFPVPSGYVNFKTTPFQFVGLNAARLGDYQRLDLRAEKDWALTRWKLVLYGEILNLTNHYNPRYVALYYAPGGQNNNIITQQGLPITPTAGLAFEF